MIPKFNIEVWQWLLIIASGLLMLLLSPKAQNAAQFFRASTKKGGEPRLWLLTSSLVISWIFAKSITNAANLGLKYGIVGGVAYATYYLSFLFAGIIIYQLREKGGFHSIHNFLQTQFGRSAVVIFSGLIAFRLFNEVWSNAMVIGSYFGEVSSGPYYAAIFVFTFLTLLYSLKGGLSSSLFTDAIQMVLFGVLLFVILGLLVPKSEGMQALITSGSWKLTHGVDLLLVALIQAISYPFHDPVMTDRGFITDAKTMVRAFAIAVPIGFLTIVLFSLIGVFAAQQGLSGQAAVSVANTLGVGAMLLMNFIMITSASSTLDSAFSSFSKLIVVDLRLGKMHLSNGRLTMFAVTLLGITPVFFGPEILDATTISGTMVIGLAPVFLLWKFRGGRYRFHASVITGICFGIWFASGHYPKSWSFVQSDYGALLSANTFGTIGCFVMYFVGSLIR
ncbi:MAG: sodium:solute symporter [Bacteroidota bacterium]